MTPLSPTGPYPSWNSPTPTHTSEAEAEGPSDKFSWGTGDADPIVAHEIAHSFLDVLRTYEAESALADDLKLHTKYLVVAEEFTSPLDASRAEAGRRLEDELAWIREAAAPTAQAGPIQVQDDVVVIGSICLARL